MLLLTVTYWYIVMNDLNELIKVFCSVKKTEEMEKLFNELFTEAERNDFASRWGLMKDLKAGSSQRNIAKARKISLCKITRGSKLLKDPNSISNKMIKKFSSKN